MKPVSAIVNARLQSSRTKSKMIRPFAGTTLVEIALEKLNQLDFFEHRFFAVAEAELKALAAPYDQVKILDRKAEAVAPGPHPALVTFEHYLRAPTQWIFVINACAAFLSIDTIRRSYDIFQKTNYGSYIAATPTRDWVFDHEGRALTHKNPYGLQNTSHAEVHYKATHSFYICNRDRFRDSNGVFWTLTPGDPHLIEMPPDEVHDVDTDVEFEISSYLYGKKLAHEKR